MAPPAWRITAQMQTTQLWGGRFVRGVEISFVTAAGHSGTVFVPEDSFNPDAVAKAVGDKAALMDSIGNLTG
jgi:hypothetical protein